MTISNRTEFEAARRRLAELQRTAIAGNDPEKHRELRELTEEVNAYQRANPAEAGGAADASTAPDLSGQNVYDPHNQNNVGTGINDPNKNDPSRNDRAVASSPPASGIAQQTPGAPGATRMPGETVKR